MKTKENKFRKHLDFLLLDLLFISLCYGLSVYLRHYNYNAEQMPSMSMYLNIWLFTLVMDVVYALLTNVYHNILRRDTGAEFLSVLKNIVILWAFIGFYMFLTQQGVDYSRNVYIVSFILTVPVLLVVRTIHKMGLRKRLPANVNLPNLLLVTTKAKAESLVRKYQERPFHSFHMFGIALVDGTGEETEIEGVPVCCTGADLDEYLVSHVVDDVLLALPFEYEYREQMIQNIVRAGVHLHINLEYTYENLPNRYLENLDGFAALSTWVSNISPWQAFLKRVLDIIGGIVGLILTGIACIFVGPAIYLASPGPIFFSQERVGKNGRRFRMVKFRSMYMDAEERKKELMAQNEVADGMMFKIENDPRIIGSEKGPGKGIGNFIRKTSIDELPQFWNVLKGDMSLVGTRPPTVDEVEKYELHHKIRLSMKPGITGLWQVSGRSDITDFEEVVKLDEEYIENWSLGLDISLLFKTVGVVVKHEGAK